MKKLLIYSLITISMLMIATKISNAQWHPGGPANSNFAHLDYPFATASHIHAVAIGDFDPPGLLPNAFFHINTNLCTLPLNGITSLGEMILTDCPSDISTYWRQQRGGVEYGTIYSLSPSDDYTGTGTGEGYHFYLQASYANADAEPGSYGDIRFNTGIGRFGSPRMRITGETGFVGIGDYTAFLPNYLLHQHGGGGADGLGTFHQFTTETTGNTADEGLRIGVDGSTNGEFNLMANTADMHFLTATTPRVTILGSNGNVGIGNYNTFLPQNRVHIHEDHLDGQPHNVYEQFTNINSYSLDPTDGFRVGITFNNSTYLNDAELIQRQGSQIRFFTDIDNRVGTSSFFNTSPADRMRIDREVRVVPGTGVLNGTFYLTRVAITEGGTNLPRSANWNFTNQTPLSLLHLGQAWQYNAGGHRPWMDVGTYYSAGSDMMYTGVKEESHATTPGLWTDHMDAVIGWGDNISAPDGADNLRVIFTANQTSSFGDASNLNGLEVARFSPLAHMGIGNFTVPAFGNGSGIQPHRRLEIYDEHNLNGNSSPAPQLRLTFTSNANVANGVWTDFQTTSQGDMYIHPYGWTTYAASTVQTPGNRYVGVNTATPGNTVEINSGITTPDASPPRQIAGLRFTNLTTASAPLTANPFVATLGTPCVLSVDASGDVVLVNDDGGGSIVTADNGLSINTPQNVQLGHALAGGSGAGLMNDREIPFNGNRLVFTDPTSINGDDNSIGIGVATPFAKLDIYRPVTNTNSVGDPIALNVRTIDYSSAGTYMTIGHCIKGTNDAPNRDNYAGTFYSTLAYRNYGVGGYALGMGVGGTSNVNNDNTGGFFRGAYGAVVNTGIIGDGESASPNATANAFGGVFSARGSTNLNYGISCSVTGAGGSTDYAAYFSGDIYCTGAYLPSDSSLKQNITPLTDALNVISQLLPKTYKYKTNQYPQMNLPDSFHTGLLAEDIEQTLPELVKTAKQPAIYDSTGNIIDSVVIFKAINYIEIIPYLIGAVQDLQARVDSLIAVVSLCCASQPPLRLDNGQTDTVHIKLNNLDNCILYQNEPNPYSNSTVIRYFIPEKMSNIKITFQDNMGRTLKEVPITSTGQGSIEVNGSELSDGIYTYSLMVAGKLIETRKMIKVK